MTGTKEIKIKLTDNILENIKIMAPLLDEPSQNQVFGYILGIINDMGKATDEDVEEKTG